MLVADVVLQLDAEIIVGKMKIPLSIISAKLGPIGALEGIHRPGIFAWRLLRQICQFRQFLAKPSESEIDVERILSEFLKCRRRNFRFFILKLTFFQK